MQNPRTGGFISGLRVYELGDDPRGNIGSADLYSTTGSLDPTRLANVTGAGFLDPSLTDAPSVPEPACLGLVGAGILGSIGLQLGRRKRLSHDRL